MADIKIYNDSKVVKVLAAEARGERLDSEVRKDMNDVVNE